MFKNGINPQVTSPDMLLGPYILSVSMEAALSNLSLPQPQLVYLMGHTDSPPSIYSVSFSSWLGPFLQEPRALSHKTLSLALSHLGSPGFEGKRVGGDLGTLWYFLEGGSGSLSKMRESLKHKASFTGANCIVQRIYSLL